MRGNIKTHIAIVDDDFNCIAVILRAGRPYQFCNYSYLRVSINGEHVYAENNWNESSDLTIRVRIRDIKKIPRDAITYMEWKTIHGKRE